MRIVKDAKVESVIVDFQNKKITVNYVATCIDTDIEAEIVIE
mgnify:CR=1 FL=1|jgi:hypothetical protein